MNTYLSSLNKKTQGPGKPGPHSTMATISKATLIISSQFPTVPTIPYVNPTLVAIYDCSCTIVSLI